MSCSAAGADIDEERPRARAALAREVVELDTARFAEAGSIFCSTTRARKCTNPPRSHDDMLESIRSFFRSSMMPAENATPAVRDRDLRRAACALLLELAHADDEFSPDERQHLEAAVRRHFGLDKAQADELLHTAERARQKATDLWQFTTLIREHYTLGQKMVLAEIMWGLVYSDGELSTREDQLMRKVSYLLGLEMGYLSEARTRVREGRSVHVDSDSVDEHRRAD